MLVDTFNSSMVRLKVQGRLGYVAVLHFQFQYGTIKSSLADSSDFSQLIFQFQYGTIKSKDGEGSHLGLHLSIPVWYD